MWAAAKAGNIALGEKYTGTPGANFLDTAQMGRIQSQVVDGVSASANWSCTNVNAGQTDATGNPKAELDQCTYAIRAKRLNTFFDQLEMVLFDDTALIDGSSTPVEDGNLALALAAFATGTDSAAQSTYRELCQAQPTANSAGFVYRPFATDYFENSQTGDILPEQFESLPNGDFEVGYLAPWALAGTVALVGGAHTGSYAAQLGSSSPSTDSSISRTFPVPPAATTLSFWYKMTCPDSVEYDWALATLTDETSGVTQNILPPTCTNDGNWHQVTANVTANHILNLTLSNHDDNYWADPTYTLFDDVTLTGPQVLSNGDFETGAVAPWVATGTSTVSSTAHGGSYAAQVGSSGPSTDSSIRQTFQVPAGAVTLSFWYQVHCPDTIQYDWATASLADGTAGTTQTALAPVCTNDGTWHQAIVAVTPGHLVTLTLANHDDDYWADPTYTLYDDVAFHGPPLSNGDFESGSLSAWSSTGIAAVTGTAAHGGSYSAQLGSTSPSTDSSLVQTFEIPAGATTLSFWYQVHCPDTVQYDWATATMSDSTASSTSIILAPTCTNDGVWRQASASVVAGHTVTLTLSNRDDNYPADPTYTLFDDVVVQ